MATMLRAGTCLCRPAPLRSGRCCVIASAASRAAPAGSAGASRRQAVLLGLALPAAALLPASGVLTRPALAEEGEIEASAVAASTAFQRLDEPTLAYSYTFPTQTEKGRRLSMVQVRAPEKYSSAAPLNADARQRIVSEYMDPSNRVTASMTVGPASGVLKDQLPDSWRPKDVANAVLVDRSTSRLSNGQRTSMNDVENVKVEVRDGQKYIVYEHVSRGSPTTNNSRKDTYRHALAATAWRAGNDGTPYLFTYNLSCPEELWPELEQRFASAIASFHLIAPTDSYIPPDQNPFLFF